ncbi:hypothetical protein NQ314_014782 [Rhamnusium bicolor]|uniref:Uncharacterized protein n=1 Tax=Rhamnusium bicolor TaxID=1586634 RepID=A0AAV8X065_9CUCU|nr:hypothetical protein NQ314_014782 [Rhamnusium bicolor]
MIGTCYATIYSIKQDNAFCGFTSSFWMQHRRQLSRNQFVHHSLDRCYFSFWIWSHLSVHTGYFF